MIRVRKEIANYAGGGDARMMTVDMLEIGFYSAVVLYGLIVV